MASLNQTVTLTAAFKDNASRGLGDLQANAHGALGKTSSSSIGTAAKWSAAGVVALGAAVVTVGMGIKSVVKKAAEFQQSMAGVAAITGASAKEMTQLTDLAKTMGKETSFSANEAAEAIQFLGMAGFDTDAIMTALPDTLSLASAGNLELGEAADIASNVMSGFRLNAEDLSMVVDGLAVTASKSNTSVGQLGQAMSFAAPGAAAAGVSFNETAAVLGVLADNGIQATRGGTSFNAMLRVMQTQSAGNTKALKDMGVELVDAEGNLRPLVDVVGDLETANLSSAEMLKFFGDEGSRAINALVGSGSRRLKELQGSIENSGGAAQKMAEIQLATFEGSMKLLGSATDGLMITLGEEFLPLLGTLVTNYITPAIGAFGDFLDKVGGLGQMFEDALAFLSGFGESFVNILDAFFSDSSFRDAFITNIGAMFASVGNTAWTWLKGLWGPEGIFAGVLKVVWEPLKFAFSLIWEPIKAAAIMGWNAVSEVVVDGMNFLIDKINVLGSVFGLTIENVDFTPLSVDAPASIEERWATMKERTKENLAVLGRRATQLGEDMTESFEATGDAAEAVWQEVVPHLADDFVRVAEKYQTATAEAITTATEKMGGEIVDTLADAGEEAGEAAGEGIAAGMEKGQPLIGKALKGIGDVFKAGPALGDRLAGGLDDALSGKGIKSIIAAQGKQIGGQFGQAMGGPIGQVVGGAIGSLAGKATAMIANLFGKGKSDFKAAAVVEEVFRAVQEGGGVGTAVYSLTDTSIGGLQKAFKEKGLSDSMALQTARQVFERSIYGESGRIINANLFALAVEQERGKVSAATTIEKYRTKVEEAAAVTGGQSRVGATVYSLRDSNLSDTGEERAEEAPLVDPVVIPEGDTFLEDTYDLSKITWPVTQAAHGFDGMVSKPTLFLAGERGTEHVSVVPSDKFAGGGSQGGRTELNFNFTVIAHDRAGVRDFIEGEARDFIAGIVREETRRGVSMVHPLGLVADEQL